MRFTLCEIFFDLFTLYLFCRDLEGVIVTIDEYGHLYCSYLGTDPSLFVAPYVENRMSNFMVNLLFIAMTTL